MANQKMLLEKLFDLSEYTELALTQSGFPRAQRYTLCAQIRGRLDEIRNLAIRCMKGYIQKSTLQNMDIAIEQLRWDIRISYRRKYISEHRLDVWMAQVDEIGRMVGGWIKKHDARRSASTNQSAPTA